MSKKKKLNHNSGIAGSDIHNNNNDTAVNKPKNMEDLFSTNYDCMKDLVKCSDSDAKMAAFTESFYNAVMTDEERWDKKGYDMMHALATGNVEYFLAVACGWGARNLAKRAMIIRDPDYRYHEKNTQAMLRVRWDDGFQADSSCAVDAATFQVWGYTKDIFKHPNNDKAKISETVVVVTPLDGGNEYEYCCVSQEELKKLSSGCLYWYDSNAVA